MPTPTWGSGETERWGPRRPTRPRGSGESGSDERDYCPPHRPSGAAPGGLAACCSSGPSSGAAPLSGRPCCLPRRCPKVASFDAPSFGSRTIRHSRRPRRAAFRRLCRPRPRPRGGRARRSTTRAISFTRSLFNLDEYDVSIPISRGDCQTMLYVIGINCLLCSIYFLHHSGLDGDDEDAKEGKNLFLSSFLYTATCGLSLVNKRSTRGKQGEGEPFPPYSSSSSSGRFLHRSSF